MHFKPDSKEASNLCSPTAENRLTAGVIREYQNRITAKTTIGEYKALGRELRERFGLTDREAIDLLNNESVLDIMVQHEQYGSLRR